jgi:protein CpxP
MKREKFLIAVIIALLISNLLLIGFLVLRPKPMHGPNGPKEIVIKKLGFDDTQVTTYEALIEEHSRKIVDLNNQVANEKKTLYTYLNDNQSTSKRDSIVNTIALIQSEIEKTHFAHFQDIKKICKPEQLPLYEKFSSEIQEIFERPKPPRRKL